jgi:hypothetical protein
MKINPTISKIPWSIKSRESLSWFQMNTNKCQSYVVTAEKRRRMMKMYFET